MKTYNLKQAEITRKWYLVDAEGKILGRLASEVAKVLMGKGKPIFTPHLDCGDHVIVVNAEKVTLTGRKLKNKIYYSHSLYPGGLKETSALKMLKEHPERLVEKAVRGMLPKNKLGDAMYTKLKVVVGSKHPHQAQQPEPMKV